MASNILLKDILQFEQLRLRYPKRRIKLRFNTSWNDEKNGKRIRRDFLEMYQDTAAQKSTFEQHIFSLGSGRQKRLSMEDIVFQFIEISPHKWLLVDGGIITCTDSMRGKNEVTGKDFLVADYNPLPEYEQFYGRVIVSWMNMPQQFFYVRQDIVDSVGLYEILPQPFLVMGNEFPGFENVSRSYKSLKANLEKSDWKNALSSIYGVYIITDTNTGKLYVGSAYGENGVYGRWSVYLTSGYDKNEQENGEYPNKKLKELVLKEGLDYIKSFFVYTLLEIFPANELGRKRALQRESYWKEVLQTRKRGYNDN